MSGVPERPEDEKEKIRQAATSLWQIEGRPSGRDVDIWLRAEAQLQQTAAISRRPIFLPIDLTFIASDTGVPPSSFRYSAFLPGEDVSPLLVTGSLLPAAGGALLRPEMLAHEARFTSVQFAQIVTAVERIARLAEWLAFQGNPPAPPVFETTGTGSKLAEKYWLALFAPDRNEPEIRQLDALLANFPVAQEIAFDIFEISLGSDFNLHGRFGAGGWLKALAVASVILNAPFVRDVSYELLVKATADLVWEAPKIAEEFRPGEKGVQGQIEIKLPTDKTQFWGSMLRDADPTRPIDP